MAFVRNNNTVNLRLTVDDDADGTREAEVAPLLVTVNQAGKLLNLGKTTVFDLINKGVLERRKVGKATRITMRSIRKVAGV